jgi:hypothetical protein
MANRKISDLTSLTAPATGDLLPIVDISEVAAADKNKKITYGELLASAPAGTAATPSFSFDSDSNTGIYSPGADTLAFTEGGVEAMRIDSSGRVGIGTTSPSVALHVYSGATDEVARFEGTGSPYISIYDSNVRQAYITADVTQIAFFVETSKALTFGTNGTERARIDSSGRLLVGTSTDSGGALLQVNGDRVRIGTAKTPASATATGATGEICWDASYIYVCTATNTWKRTAIATW